LSDIFISYKREEQPTAKRLALALERSGWSVWWDPHLRVGEHFDDAIEEALRDAKCVIVLWSEKSVESRYVRDEATYALNREKLIPVAIEDVAPPFRFAGLQTAQLHGWDGSDVFPEFLKLVASVRSKVDPSLQGSTEINLVSDTETSTLSGKKAEGLYSKSAKKATIRNIGNKRTGLQWISVFVAPVSLAIF